jgi:magnesium-transporting ATPase (P-type)
MNLPKSTKNLVTIAGVTIALVSLLLIVLLFIISTSFESNNSFLGIFIYMALPALMVFGLILIPVGMLKGLKSEKLQEHPTTLFGILTNHQHEMLPPYFS